MNPYSIPVLDCGHVELIDSMGSDLRIVNAAQASFDKRSDLYGTRELGILRALMRDRHGVPFEAVSFTFGLRLPIAIARQFVKHRMSSWSEQSGRYDQLRMQFYVPAIEDIKVQVGKPMEYRFEQASMDRAVEFFDDLVAVYEFAQQVYERHVSLGIAKEQARLCLPVGTYTNVVWTLNLRSLLNFLSLRMDSHAQAEARYYADAIHRLAMTVVPDTMALWDELGRPTP